MSTSTNHRRVSRFSIRFVAAVASAAAVLGGLPTVLVAVALQRFDDASPLHGVERADGGGMSTMFVRGDAG